MMVFELLPGQVDGVRNPKVQSIFLDDMPIHQAAFASGGSHVRLASYRHHGGGPSCSGGPDSGNPVQF